MSKASNIGIIVVLVTTFSLFFGFAWFTQGSINFLTVLLALMCTAMAGAPIVYFLEARPKKVKAISPSATTATITALEDSELRVPQYELVHAAEKKEIDAYLSKLGNDETDRILSLINPDCLECSGTRYTAGWSVYRLVRDTDGWCSTCTVAVNRQLALKALEPNGTLMILPKDIEVIPLYTQGKIEPVHSVSIPNFALHEFRIGDIVEVAKKAYAYTSPGVQSTILVQPGYKVKVREIRDGWIRGDKYWYGYHNLKLLKRAPEISALPKFKTGDIVEVTTDSGLNLRIEPNQNSKSIRVLGKYAELKVLEVRNNWLKVEYLPHLKGYVRDKYVKVSGEG